MKPLDKYVGAHLWWRKRSLLSRHYDLVTDEGEVLGQMTIEGFPPREGRVEMEGLNLGLRWRGLFDRGTSIIDLDTGQQIGRLHLSLFDRGEFRFESGRRYKFRVSFGRGKCTVTDDLGDVQFTILTKAFSGRAKVVLGTGLLSRRELSAMVSAAQYSLILMSREPTFVAGAA